MQRRATHDGTNESCVFYDTNFGSCVSNGKVYTKIVKTQASTLRDGGRLR